MAIPITYNIRNLIVRKTTTLMTGAGIALTVAVLLAVLGLLSGLQAAFGASGDPLHVLVSANVAAPVPFTVMLPITSAALPVLLS